MRYIIVNEKEIDQNHFVNVAETLDERMHYSEIFTLMHFSCVEISEDYWQVISKEWEHKYKELTASQAYNGSNFFGEVRPYGKIMTDQNAQGVSQAWTPAGGVMKTAITLTAEPKQEIMDFMILFAKEIVDDEFNVRIRNLRDTSEVEVASWEIQKHEAREWLREKGANGSRTPFLDYIATERSLTKDVLANKILTKAEAYEDNLSTLLVKHQKVIKEFENCNSIWDLNIVYEDRLGVIMPQTQAIEMGRTISDTDWDRKTDYEIKAHVFKF